MNTVVCNGITLRYDIAEAQEGLNAPWLILAHSLATDLTLWDDNLAALTQKFRVLRFDTRGHGGSSAPETAYDFTLLTADVLGLMNELGIERAHFCGISMGGMIAQHVALAAPRRIAKLVLVSTTSGYPPEARALWAERIAGVRQNGLAPLVQPTLERWFTEPFRTAQPQIMQRIGALIAATPVAGYIGSGQAIASFDITDRVGAIRSPTLVIVGSEDTGTPPAMGQKIVETILGAHLETIQSASHLCNIEQAAVFNRLLLDFL